MPLFNLYSCVSPLRWQGVFVWLCHVTMGCYTILQFQRLPFLFPYYGHTLSYIGVTTNGMILLQHLSAMHAHFVQLADGLSNVLSGSVTHLCAM